MSAHLVGPKRMLATTSEVLELDDAHVLLRAPSAAIASKTAIDDLAQAIDPKGSFKIQVAQGVIDPTAVTIAHLEEKEKREARKALVQAFRSDPFVQKCLETLDATLIESSVHEVNEKQ